VQAESEGTHGKQLGVGHLCFLLFMNKKGALMEMWFYERVHLFVLFCEIDAYFLTKALLHLSQVKFVNLLY
jgi:hypothetical protein